jgi:hypothetical protein
MPQESCSKDVRVHHSVISTLIKWRVYLDFMMFFFIRLRRDGNQRNLSKPNILGTRFCVGIRQVFALFRLNLQRSRPHQVQLIQESVLLRGWFRHVSMYN